MGTLKLVINIVQRVATYLLTACVALPLLGGLILSACQDENEDIPHTQETGRKEYSEENAEWFPGGENGTVFMANHFAYRQAMPFIDADPTYNTQFMRGERIFEKSFVTQQGMGYEGLGPVYIRKSCVACHPSYGGRGQRVDAYDSNDSHNCYLLMIYDPSKPELPLASKYFTGMTQTRAVSPFKPPVDEKGIHIKWLEHVDEFGNRYEDGTAYSLIYPEVTIDQSAILFPDFDMSQHAASIEATIGIYGIGLIDAISDEDIREQYSIEQSRGYARGLIGPDIEEKDPSNPFPGKHPGRFTYLLTRGTLDNGPGSNAIWNITNVTRPERTYHYITDEYAKLMAADLAVQQKRGETYDEIYSYLMSKDLPVEFSKEDYDAFMVWHRSLAVPAARSLDNPTVQRGRDIFYSSEAGCTACHRPEWSTRDYYSPMPELSRQRIFPYTDLLRHDLGMKNPGRVQVCRTTPLWGRGLMPIVSGHEDKLHDLRARNYEEAILWHGGEAQMSKEYFRKLSKSDRDALVAFLKAI
jgi:CxxC motif-containing protein (DUF1111 family)